MVHIDYEKAPSVIQRFGDVKQLITQTLDPMLSAYFRDVRIAVRCSNCDERTGSRSRRAKSCGANSLAFDIECVDVLIGKPETASENGA